MPRVLSVLVANYRNTRLPGACLEIASISFIFLLRLLTSESRSHWDTYLVELSHVQISKQQGTLGSGTNHVGDYKMQEECSKVD